MTSVWVVQVLRALCQVRRRWGGGCDGGGSPGPWRQGSSLGARTVGKVAAAQTLRDI